MSSMTVQWFSELDFHTFLGECTGPTVWSTATLLRFALLMALLPSHRALSGPNTDTCTPCVLAFPRVQLAPPVPDRTLHLVSSNLTSQRSVEFGDEQAFQDRLARHVLLDDRTLLAVRGGELGWLIFFAMCLRHGCPDLVRHGFMSEGLVVLVQLLRFRWSAMCGLLDTPSSQVRLNSFTDPTKQRSPHQRFWHPCLSDQSSSTRLISLMRFLTVYCASSLSAARGAGRTHQ